MQGVSPPELEVNAVKKPGKNVRPNTHVKMFGDVTELRNKYGYNLPPIATLHRLYDRERNKLIINNILRSENITPTVIRLLFTGRLPLGYFNDLCYGKFKPPNTKKPYHHDPKRERVRELWEPKRTFVTSAKEIERAIFEARSRHRHRLDDISLKAHKHFKDVEEVMMRHLYIEPSGRTCYLQRMDRETQRLNEPRKKKQVKKTREIAAVTNAENKNNVTSQT